MPELPAGTVTFVFTDIEGSTRLLLELGDDYASVLADHRSALRDAFARHSGVEVDTQGDAFFVWDAASRPRRTESAVVPRRSGSKTCSYAGERTFALPRGRAEKFVKDYRTEAKVRGALEGFHP